MRKTDHTVGACGLFLEFGTLAIFVMYFVIARFSIAGATLPLSKAFIHYVVLPIFFAPLIGIIGLFCDQRRSLSICTILFGVPTLIVMGVLNGSF